MSIDYGNVTDFAVTYFWGTQTNNHQIFSSNFRMEMVSLKQKVNCTVSCSVDKVSWVCHNGHGTIYTQYHHVERHTCSHCEGMDYYADN